MSEADRESGDDLNGGPRSGTTGPAPAPPEKGGLRGELAAVAHKAGFDAVGVTAPDGLDDAGARLFRFLGDGHHATMDWMDKTAGRRCHPRALWPDARSIVVLAMNYAPDHDPLTRLTETERAVISVYAKGKDYHSVIKKRLKQVAGWLAVRAACRVKVFVDTAPLMEKPLAAAAGLGWQGKHTNLVSREFGSWLFLGVIATDATIPHDVPEQDHCGTCRRCLDVCPTNAFPTPYRLDARRCISYLTIEHRGPIPREFRKPMGNRVFGCDDCLAVCPWNKFAQGARETRFAARNGLDDPPICDLLALSPEAFEARFAGTPVKRTGHAGLLRNALIAAGNSGDGALVRQVAALLDHEAATVRGAAVWALRQLQSADQLLAVRQAHLAREDDEGVRSEWTEPCGEEKT